MLILFLKKLNILDSRPLPWFLVQKLNDRPVSSSSLVVIQFLAVPLPAICIFTTNGYVVSGRDVAEAESAHLVVSILGTIRRIGTTSVLPEILQGVHYLEIPILLLEVSLIV